MTKGGDSFAELAQEVANHVGTMESKYDGYDLIGYEYKNIDGQMAWILENGGLILKDENLADRALNEREEAKRNTGAEREEAVRTALLDASKSAVAKLAADMVAIPGKDFAICKYEVTQALWFAIMGDNPSYFKGANRPVEEVSWNDCQKFLEKLNSLPEVQASGFTYRLPSEDEWDYACRAGGTGDYCKLTDGAEITDGSLGEVAWFGSNSEDQTHPVGQKKPNAFGLHDMLGNVWEWTSTGGEVSRECCGGGFYGKADDCLAGDRLRYTRDTSDKYLGFRLAR